MSTEKFKESVQNWKEIVEANAYADSIGAFAESIVSASPIVDKTSTWAAAGVATIAGLLITNIDNISTVYNPNEIKCLLFTLGVSILFALIRKYLSTMCSTALKVSEEISVRYAAVLGVYEGHRKQIEELSSQHGLGIKPEHDFTKIKESYINLFPKWALIFMRSRIEKSFNDRNYGHKYIVKIFYIQSVCAFLQYVLIVIFVSVAAIYI